MLKKILEDLITTSSDKNGIMGTLDNIYHDIVDTYAEVEEKNHSYEKNKTVKVGKNHDNKVHEVNFDTFTILQEIKKDNESLKKKFSTYESNNKKILNENAELKRQLLEQNNNMLSLKKEMGELKGLILSSINSNSSIHNTNISNKPKANQQKSAPNSEKSLNNITKTSFLNMPVKFSGKKSATKINHVEKETNHIFNKEEKSKQQNSPISTDLLTTVEEQVGADNKNNGNSPFYEFYFRLFKY